MATLLPDLSDTHREIQRLAREFAQGEVAPHAAEWNAAHHVPVDVLRRMGELGFLGVIIPEEDGGAGLDYTCLTLVIEEHRGRRRRHLRRGRGAELAGRGPDRALRDPGAAPGGAPGPGLRGALRGLRARRARPRLRRRGAADGGVPREGGGWSVSGSKQWITNGGIAEVFILFARTGGEGPKGVSCFLVGPDEGFVVRRGSRSSGCTPPRPSSWRSTASRALARHALTWASRARA